MYLWLLADLAFADPTWAAMQAATWRPISTREHEAAGTVQVFQANVAGIECFRGLSTSSASPETLLAIVSDVPSATRWSTAGITASEVLSQGAGKVDYYQYLDVPGWTLASDRYWIVRGTFQSTATGAEFVWTRPTEWGPLQAKVDALRAQNADAVEPPINTGAWRFTRAEAGSQVEYLICTHAGGSIPESVQAMGTKQTLPDTVGDVIREAKRRGG